jgi:Apea-like HEPN
VFYSSLKVAYSHYSKALTDIARVEERIMNTVIGLESLLLHENQDNTLRFWLRGAKILSFFNYSPMKIKNTLKSAYGVRSSFVHGNDSDLNKEMIKFSKNEGSW